MVTVLLLIGLIVIGAMIPAAANYLDTKFPLRNRQLIENDPVNDEPSYRNQLQQEDASDNFRNF